MHIKTKRVETGKLFLHALFTERKEMFYLTTHSTHFIYTYMVLDIW